MNLKDFSIIQFTPVEYAGWATKLVITIFNTISIFVGIVLTAYFVGLGLKLGLGL